MPDLDARRRVWNVLGTSARQNVVGPDGEPVELVNAVEGIALKVYG